MRKRLPLKTQAKFTDWVGAICVRVPHTHSIAWQALSPGVKMLLFFLISAAPIDRPPIMEKKKKKITSCSYFNVCALERGGRDSMHPNVSTYVSNIGEFVCRRCGVSGPLVGDSDNMLHMKCPWVCKTEIKHKRRFVRWGLNGGDKLQQCRNVWRSLGSGSQKQKLKQSVLIC